MRVIRALLLFTGLTGGWALAYEGDGVFTDRGRPVAHERYVLDLGPVQLRKPWRREYALADLPTEEFTVGLQFDGDTDGKSVDAKVRVTLTNERGETVLEVADALANWTWGTSPGRLFVYRRGVQKEIPFGQSSVRLQRVALGPDGGWGTYFSPRRGGRYRLVFETLDANRANSAKAKLVALGGGWK